MGTELTKLRNQIFDAAFEAEKLWENELKRVYGKKYLDARYDTKLNQATDNLKKLYDMRSLCLKAWYRASDIKLDVAA